MRRATASARRILLIVNDNYNWLQDFLVLIFSPVLYNEQSSLIIINYAVFLIGTILIFRTALLCGTPRFWAFCAALLYAAMPWNFQMRMQFSLTSLMPEPVYMTAYLCAAILLSWLISNPYSRRIAVRRLGLGNSRLVALERNHKFGTANRRLWPREHSAPATVERTGQFWLFA